VEDWDGLIGDAIAAGVKLKGTAIVSFTMFIPEQVSFSTAHEWKDTDGQQYLASSRCTFIEGQNDNRKRKEGKTHSVRSRCR
jgi:hypothetical protein